MSEITQDIAKIVADEYGNKKVRIELMGLKHMILNEESKDEVIKLIETIIGQFE